MARVTVPRPVGSEGRRRGGRSVAIARGGTDWRRQLVQGRKRTVMRYCCGAGEDW